MGQRLIDANELIEIFTVETNAALNDSGVVPLPIIRQIIEDMPTIEPAVVHEPTEAEFRRMAIQRGYELVLQ